MSGGERSARQGALSRLGIGAQVALTSLLAFVAVLLVNWLAGRPGLRARLDLTASGQNTVSTATRGVLDRLPGEVVIDVFYREEEIELLRPVMNVVYQRTARLLTTLRQSGGGKVTVQGHDMGDPQAVQARLRELKIEGFENCLVVSYGGQREVLRFRGQLAVIDPGSGPRPDADFRPPRLAEFNAERELVEALLKVTRGEQRAVYFCTGQGEREVFGEADEGLDRLASLLADEGLVVNRWSPVEDGPLPDDCACLTIVGPQDRFGDEALDGIERYLRAGGRVVAAPHPDDGERADRDSRLGELLGRFGVELQGGIVCQPAIDPQTGQVGVGVPQVSAFFVHPDNMSAHPLMAPLRDDRRTFMISGAKPLRVVTQPPQGVTAPLFTSRASVGGYDSWVDSFQDSVPPLDFRPDPRFEAMGKRFVLALATSFRPADADTPAALEQETEARLVVLGSSSVFANSLFPSTHDLLRNVYNWVLDREYRLMISPRDPDLRRIPAEAEQALPRINRFVWGWLPGLAAAAGIFTALRRRGGGPRSARRGAGGEA